MRNKIHQLRNHIHNHRGAYASLATTAVFATLITRNAKILNEFLEEHDLMEAYYGTIEEIEGIAPE